MRRVVIISILLAILFGASWGTKVEAADAQTPARVIFVKSLSTKVSQSMVEERLAALQQNLDDLASVWGIQYEYTTDPAQAGTAFATLTVTDHHRGEPYCGCYGFHDVKHRRPYAIVYAEDAWTVTFSHEAEELAIDPWINHFARFGGKTWLVEVGDPVEEDTYLIDGVEVSDFITPRWYDASLPGNFDWLGKLQYPGTLTVGGYASWYDHGWHQVFA